MPLGSHRVPSKLFGVACLHAVVRKAEWAIRVIGPFNIGLSMSALGFREGGCQYTKGSSNFTNTHCKWLNSCKNLWTTAQRIAHTFTIFCRVGGWIADTFDKTPIMTTYLVAVAVTDYKFKQGYTRDGIKVSTVDGILPLPFPSTTIGCFSILISRQPRKWVGSRFFLVWCVGI
jgi:hypothetical protein